MIKLTKQAEPDVLKNNGDLWTNTLLDKLSRGEVVTSTEKTRYRHPDIKDALISETKGKCAYCESKLLHTQRGDIEHIHPKSLAPEKTFKWDNLTLSCEICNQNKSARDPQLECIIDPYAINPADHIIFQGALAFSLGTAHGISTIDILELNRMALAEARKSQLEKIMSIFQTLFRLDLPLQSKKAIFRNLLKNEGSDNGPYTAMAIEAINRMSSKLPSEVTSVI
jgi:hypothetical protein